MCTAPDAGTARHDSNPIGSGESSWRIGVLVEKRKHDVGIAIAERHIDDSTEPEAEQDSTLHPRNRPPFTCDRIFLRCPDLASFESIEKLPYDGAGVIREVFALRCR